MVDQSAGAAWSDGGGDAVGGAMAACWSSVALPLVEVAREVEGGGRRSRRWWSCAQCAPTMMVTTRVRDDRGAGRGGAAGVAHPCSHEPWRTRCPGIPSRTPEGGQAQATRAARRGAPETRQKAQFVPPYPEAPRENPSSHPATAMSAPMIKRTVCFLRAAARFTGARGDGACRRRRGPGRRRPACEQEWCPAM